MTLKISSTIGASPHHFHHAASFDYRQIIADKLANTGAIQIFKAGEIQHNVLISICYQALDGFAENPAIHTR